MIVSNQNSQSTNNSDSNRTTEPPVILLYRVHNLARPAEIAPPEDSAPPAPEIFREELSHEEFGSDEFRNDEFPNEESNHDLPNQPLTICAAADPDAELKAPRKRRRPKQTKRAGAPIHAAPQTTRRSEPPADPNPTLKKRRLPYTAKRRGEIAEAKFLAHAAELGYTVLKPWGESDAYDFVLDSRRHGRLGLARVQVKSAHQRNDKDLSYAISTHGGSLSRYSERDVDAFIAIVVPLDAYYVIPSRVFARLRGLRLYPCSKRHRSKYEKYRDAWHYLEPQPRKKTSSAADRRR